MYLNVMTYRPCRLLLVDGHPIIRRGLKALLQSEPDMIVSGEASGGREVLEQMRRYESGVVVLEPHLPDVGGLEIIRAIRQRSRQLEILIFTACSSPDAVRAALAAGSRGYALKSDEPSEIIRAVRSVWGHRPYVTPQLAPADPLPGRQLSRREVAVMKLLAGGFNNTGIASALGASKRTVEALRENIRRKLRCQSFSEMIRFAFRLEMSESFDPGTMSLLRARAPGFPGARTVTRAARSEGTLLPQFPP